jgi:hypothetical protein
MARQRIFRKVYRSRQVESKHMKSWQRQRQPEVYLRDLDEKHPLNGELGIATFALVIGPQRRSILPCFRCSTSPKVFSYNTSSEDSHRQLRVRSRRTIVDLIQATILIRWEPSLLVASSSSSCGAISSCELKLCDFLRASMCLPISFSRFAKVGGRVE